MIPMTWTATEPDKDHIKKDMMARERMIKIKRRVRLNMRMKSPQLCQKILRIFIKRVGIIMC